MWGRRWCRWCGHVVDGDVDGAPNCPLKTFMLVVGSSGMRLLPVTVGWGSADPYVMACESEVRHEAGVNHSHVALLVGGIALLIDVD